MKSAPPLLYIMRHAEAAQALGRDHARMLTDNGRRESETIGKSIMSDFRPPRLLLVSSATRARQTAACLGLLPPAQTRVSDRLYHGDDQTYMDEIRQCDADCLLVIGHNPSVLQLVHRICKPDSACATLPLSFPAACLAVVELCLPLGLCGPQTGRLITFLTPQEALAHLPQTKP